MKIKFSYIRKVNLLKTLWVNFRFFDWKTACHFPILIGYNTVIAADTKKPFKLSKEFDLKGKKVEIGCKQNFTHSGTTRVEVSKKNSQIIFSNGATIRRGAIVLCHHGVLSLGHDTHLGQNTLVICHHRIEIGNHVAIAWGSSCYDSNFHYLCTIKENERSIRNCHKSVRIGDYVWCGNNATIAPGAVIPDHSIIGQFTLVNKDFSHIKTKGNLFVGIPAIHKETTPFYSTVWNTKVERVLDAYFLANKDKEIFKVPPEWPAVPWSIDFSPSVLPETEDQKS